MPTVGLIGAGLIGCSWAAVFARAGWTVRITDPSRAALANAPALIAAALRDRPELAPDLERAAQNVSVVATLEDAARDADLVQESAPETVDTKQAIFAKLDKAAPRRAILASSTSTIVASRFTEQLEGRARCLVAHPINPPHLVPVVELVPAPWTAPATVAEARRIFAAAGQVAIEVRREIDGFVVNRLQGALLSEAFRLVGEGYVTPEDLDYTIRDGLALRWSFMGPFETIELNAPGGMRDYCERYAAGLERLQRDPAPPSLWDRVNWEKVVRQWTKPLAPDAIARKSLWRNRRLAALAEHKSKQEPNP